MISLHKIIRLLKEPENLLHAPDIVQNQHKKLTVLLQPGLICMLLNILQYGVKSR